MPAAGTTKIPKPKKAQILADKRVKMLTTKQVAKKHKVTPRTVYEIAKTRDPEILSLAEDFQQRLISQAKRNVTRGMEVIGERIENPKELLHAVTGAIKLSHEVYRLETNQPTTINQNQKPPIEYAIEFARTLLAEQPPEIAREIFRRAKTVQVGIRATDEDWIEAEARVFEKGL